MASAEMRALVAVPRETPSNVDLSCAADGRFPSEAREPPNASRSGPKPFRGDDSLPTLGQAWLRE